MKISEKWKRPVRLALVTIILVILLMANEFGVKFGFHFDFQSIPEKTVSPPLAQRTTGLWLTPESS